MPDPALNFSSGTETSCLVHAGIGTGGCAVTFTGAEAVTVFSAKPSAPNVATPNLHDVREAAGAALVEGAAA